MGISDVVPASWHFESGVRGSNHKLTDTVIISFISSSGRCYEEGAVRSKICGRVLGELMPRKSP